MEGNKKLSFANNILCKSVIKITIVISLLVATGCASRNITGDFDCPAESGKKCETMKRADKKALEKLQSGNRSQVSQSSNKESSKKIIQSQQKKRIVKIAPFTDEKGNYHEKSEVIYYEE
ncbi:MAG: hypothetical protein O3C05_00995 [Proteobacteria bacterium]|nr:hypothetical protein [Pseudomonadota bacterium]